MLDRSQGALVAIQGLTRFMQSAEENHFRVVHSVHVRGPIFIALLVLNMASTSAPSDVNW